MRKTLNLLLALVTASAFAQSPGDPANFFKGAGIADVKTYTARVNNSVYSINGVGSFALLPQSTFAAAAHTHTASQVTDFNATGDARWSLLAHTHSFASLTSKPTTVGGYGITDFHSLGSTYWSLLGHAHVAADVTDLGTLATQNGTFSGTHSGTSSGTNTGDQTLGSLGLATSTTNEAIIRADGTTGGTQNSGVIISDANAVTGMSTLSLPNTGLRLADTGGSRFLAIAPGSALTTLRTLTLTTGDANRTLELSGNTTLGGGTHSGTNTGDQTITLTGMVTGSGTGSFAATVVTNANLTGVVTSVGNATAIADAALSIAKTSGLQTALTARHLVVPITAQAALTWTDMPAAVTFFNGQATRSVYKLDLTGYTQCRIVVVTAGAAAANTGRLAIKYKTTSYSTTVGDYSDIGTGATEVAASVTSTITQTDSGWITLEAAARADVQVAVVGLGSNGTNDPVFGNIALHFR